MSFALDAAAEQALWDEGCALVRGTLAPDVCAALVAAFDDDARYRTTVDMARHRFGRGTYRYYCDPLPESVAGLRAAAYAALAPVAAAWNAATRVPERYPAELATYEAACAEAGQPRPASLVLRYRTGDFNALHVDRYGERAFPFQLTVFLSERASYGGGESVFVTTVPRAQSVARVVVGERGDALVFANDYRPLGGDGRSRGRMRHGVSTVTHGERFALGAIFHGAR